MSKLTSFIKKCYPWKDQNWNKNNSDFIDRLSLDFNYKVLYEKNQSLEDLEVAGFFMDGIKQSDLDSFFSKEKLDIALTPLPSHHQLEKFKDVKEPLVFLLSTGSFAPIHDGHANMMLAAERKALEMGLPVVGCYFSPSHDSYVGQKDNGKAGWFNACWRVDYSKHFLQKHEFKTNCWVDPWETLVPVGSINFTLVSQRLKKYLEHHLNREVKILYVFGSDNAGFGNAFAKDNSICVLRPNYKPSSNSIIANSNISSSSTEIRKTWDFEFVRSEVGAYFFRDEKEWAISNEFSGVEQKVLTSTWEDFKKELTEIIKDSFNSSKVKPRFFGTLSLPSQKEKVKRWVENEPQELFLNMDECTQDVEGIYSLSLSRYFNSDGHQSSPVKLDKRIGSNNDEVFRLLRGKEVILIDDDSTSGFSLFSAKEILKQNDIRVKEVRLIFSEDIKIPKKDVFDIIDFRDFLIGAKSCGLVVSGTYEDKKVPYWSYEVSLCTRASIPFGSSWDCKRKIALANRRFYQRLSLKEPKLIQDVLELYSK